MCHPSTSLYVAFTRCVSSIVFLIVVSCSAGRAQIRHLVSLRDLETLEDATYLQVSPTGEMVAYVWKEHLWVMSTQQGSSPRQFGDAKFPLWSPDGMKLAYYSAESGTSQLWILNLDKSKAEQVTALKEGIDPDPTMGLYWFFDPLRFSWSPDGTKLVFASRVIENADDTANEAENFSDLSSKTRTQPLVLAANTPADWTLRGVLRSASNLPKWSLGQKRSDELSAKKVSQLFVVELLRRTVQQFTHDHAGYYHPAWSPDGRTIACVSADGKFPSRGSPATTNIYLVDVATHKRRALTIGTGEKRVPTWSPDGTSIAYLARHGFGQQSVFVVPHDGRAKPINCTGIMRRHVLDFQWWPNSMSLMVVTVDGVSWPISRVGIQPSHEVLRIGNEPSHRWPVSVSRTGVLVWQQSDGSRIGSIFVRHSGNDHSYLLVDLNPQVQTWELGKQEVVKWKNARGEPKEGVLIKPAGYKAGIRYPLIVDGYPHMGNGFFGWAMLGNQAWASMGYAVFFPDARAPHVYENHFKTEVFDQAGRGPHGWGGSSRRRNVRCR